MHNGLSTKAERLLTKVQATGGRTRRSDYGRVSSSWRRFSHLCGGMYRGLSEVAGVMGDGLWCPLTETGLRDHHCEIQSK